MTTLEKLKLVDHLTTELTVDKSKFIRNLSTIVDRRSLGLFSDTFDWFAPGNKMYKGLIGTDRFRIKRKRTVFGMTSYLPIAEGRFRQHGEKMVIETKINGFHGKIKLISIFIPIFYLFSLTMILSNGTPFGTSLLTILFFCIHAALLIGIPLIIMRASVAKLKYDLEREFNYLIK